METYLLYYNHPGHRLISSREKRTVKTYMIAAKRITAECSVTDSSILLSVCSVALLECLTNCFLSEDNTAFIYVLLVIWSSLISLSVCWQPSFLQLLVSCPTSDITVCDRSILLELQLLMTWFPPLFHFTTCVVSSLFFQVSADVAGFQHCWY